MVASPCTSRFTKNRGFIQKAVTTLILENQEKALREDRAFLSEAAPTNSTGTAIDNWDPILISLVRRSMPNLIAYDICGVQPMTGPTGLIFAMRSRFSSQTGKEALADESQQDFSNQNALVQLVVEILLILQLTLLY